MKQLEKVANAYCKTVAAAIPVHGKKRTEYLRNLRQDAMDYLSTHPWSKADDLCKRFGTPEDISIAFVSEMSMDEINERFRARNRVIKIAMAVAVLALLLLLGAIIWMLIRNHQDMSGYLVVTG